MSATVCDLIAAGAERLGAAGIESGRREARLLLAAAMGLRWEDLTGGAERAVTGEAADRFDRFVARRAAREPVSRILGAREFWSLDFMLSPATLDPRPDSEALVEAALEEIEDRDAPLSILDLGCGTGCLLLALLAELPRARGLGVDLAPAAVATAAANAQALGFGARARFLVADWDAGIAGRFDVVVSNPPYIPSGEIDALAPEVARHDPRLALDGGTDGLAAHRALARVLPRRLAAAGIAVIEHGDGQGPAAERIYATAGLVICKRRADLGGRRRCLVAARNGRKKTVGKAPPTV
ncbi:MAG: peptide chain release factor N(5)-glutamine methyltransferase [Pseudomonadota bacterium]